MSGAASSSSTTRRPLPSTSPPVPNGPPLVTPDAPRPTASGRPKKKAPEPPDPVSIYESVRNRIAALEEFENREEEEDQKTAEEANLRVKDMSDSAIHQKYVELYQQLKRVEREHVRERQKLIKDKDATRSQLNKANLARTKLENLARELQKDNKRLREDSKRLLSSVEDAQEVIETMKNEIERRVDDVKSRRQSFRDSFQTMALVPARHSATNSNRSSNIGENNSPERKSIVATNTIATTNINSAQPSPPPSLSPPLSPSLSSPKSEFFIKVMCKYRVELAFKVTRKMKLERLFSAWSMRMASSDNSAINASTDADAKSSGSNPNSASLVKEYFSHPATTAVTVADFIFTHYGRSLNGDNTVEEAGIEENDVIIAIEMMDLTEDGVGDLVLTSQRERLKKHWQEDPIEARKAVDEIFDTIVQTRLIDLLRQYELRERHFEAILRSKELEVLLAKARAEEQKNIAEAEKDGLKAVQSDNKQLQQSIEAMHSSQTKLMDKLIACCKEPTGENSQRLFAFLREELQKRGSLFGAKLDQNDMGGTVHVASSSNPTT